MSLNQDKTSRRIVSLLECVVAVFAIVGATAEVISLGIQISDYTKLPQPRPVNAVQQVEGQLSKKINKEDK